MFRRIIRYQACYEVSPEIQPVSFVLGFLEQGGKRTGLVQEEYRA